MANKNPNPATRFKPGVRPIGAGRPTGARDRITTAFLTAIADDFEKHGVKTVEAVRESDPSTYLRVVQATLPKEIEIKRPLEGMDDGKLAEAIEMLSALIRAQAPEANDDDPKVLQ